MLFAADKGAGTGGSGNPLSIEEQLTAARSETTTLQGSLSAITTERDSLLSERDSLRGQFDSATLAATTAQSELATVHGELEAARVNVTSLTAARDTAAQNVARMETLCGVRGIAKDAAVPTVPDAPASTHVYDQWHKATGADKTRLWRAHRSDIRAEGERRMATSRV